MGKTRKSQRGGGRRSVSTNSSSGSSSSSSSSSDHSRGYRRSRSRHVDRYYDKRPDARMFSPGYGGAPMNGVYPMQSGMMPNSMMPPIPSSMLPPYGVPPAPMTQPGMIHAHQMQPPIYPYQNGMMSWPYQGSQIGAPQMQPSVPPTPVFQFQISPGKNSPGRK
ncbi:hypothetical protein ECG_05901 [Echinococcus granulosus]|uniref:Expressed conserved protein n=1 Tax=Echinococcus granulosus TaxID=6210 RepID=A0A068WFH1_ECHGR|nr:hypothetical protein ECG_05901 [Echinococcus granulosus]CDS18827.1 expressed conserved protein [Echinococcus granulosus]